jgi:drug/metabolite transporter (DMT)-like permease
LWTFFIGLIFLPRLEVFSLKKLSGLLIGWTGIALISLEAIRFGGGTGEILGMVAVMLMAVSYSIGTLLSRYLLAGPVKVDFRANLYHQHCASLTFLIIVTLLTGQFVNPSTFIFSPGFWGAIVYLSLFSTAGAWIIYYHLIREWGAVRASTVTYCVPMMALFWDFIFFSTVPSAIKIVGAILILSGVILIQVPMNFNFMRRRGRLSVGTTK